MKQPDDSPIGTARKTLPTRKAHKLPRLAHPASAKKPPTRKPLFNENSQHEWLKIFDEK